MVAAVKYRDIVREIALDQYGYVTTRDAVEAGVPAIELPKLAARGGLKNISYGLYQVSGLPTSPFDQFAEALLRAGEGAYLHGESVLALFGFADVNLRRIKVAIPRRTRAKFPEFMEVIEVKNPASTTFYEGLASQPVADAILECRGRIENTRLRDTTKQARKEGLLTTSEYQRVLKGLRS